MICFVIVVTPKFREVSSHYYSKVANVKQLAKSITDGNHGVIISYELYKPMITEAEVIKYREVVQLFDKVVISHAEGLKFDAKVRQELEDLGVDIFEGSVPSYFWKGD